MNRLMASVGALALLVFGSAAMAGPDGDGAERVLEGAGDTRPPIAGPPTETEMPTSDTDATDDDRLPQGDGTDRIGDSIDSGHEGG